MFAFLYWLMQNPPGTKPRKPKLPLSKKARKLLRMLRALDSVRTLQLARAGAGIFTSA